MNTFAQHARRHGTGSMLRRPSWPGAACAQLKSHIQCVVWGAGRCSGSCAAAAGPCPSCCCDTSAHLGASRTSQRNSLHPALHLVPHHSYLCAAAPEPAHNTNKEWGAAGRAACGRRSEQQPPGQHRSCGTALLPPHHLHTYEQQATNTFTQPRSVTQPCKPSVSCFCSGKLGL